MSYVSPLKLKPIIPTRELVPGKPLDSLQLLGWLLYNPYALSEYASTFDLRKSLLARWRLFAHVLLLYLGVLLILALAIPFVANRFELNSIHLGGDLFVSLGLGAFFALCALLIMGEMLNLPVAASMFAFSFGLVLPILNFSQLTLLQNGLDGANTATVLANLRWFCFIFGFSIGHLLNNLVLSLRMEREDSITEMWIRWLVVLGMLLGAVLFNGQYFNGTLGAGIINLLLVGIAALVGYLRPLNAIYGLTVDNTTTSSTESIGETARVAATVPGMDVSMASWLNKDWLTGVNNLSEFWQYSNLRGVVAKSIHKDLKRVQKAKAAKEVEYTDEDIPKRVVGLLSGTSWNIDELASRMYDKPWDFWNPLATQLKLFANELRKGTFEYQLPIPGAKRPTASVWRPTFAQTDDVDHTMAGLLYLYHVDPGNALESFKKISAKTDIVKEFTAISETLKELQSKRFSPEMGTKAKFPAKPDKTERTESWKAIDEFKELMNDSWLFVRTRDDTLRQSLRQSAWSHWNNLNKNSAPTPERETISRIAQNWKGEFKNWIESDKYSTPKEIKSPYKTDSPIETKHKLFAGRKEQIDAIKNAIVAGRPLLLYGNAKIGKTSLLNAAIAAAKPALTSWVDLRGLNLPDMSVGQQAFKMLGQSLRSQTQIKPNGDLTNYVYFHDYLDEVSRMFAGTDKRVVIILDNFEEALLNNTAESDLSWLVRFLGGMHFQARNICLIFSGRLIPDEFDQLCLGAPLRDLIKLKVSFVDEATTKTILNTPINQPSSSILARFDEAAIKGIQDHSHGHPYLTQLIAQCIMNRYNKRIKDKTGDVEPIFQKADVDTIVIHEPAFWIEATPFIESLIEQSLRYAPQVESILTVLALHPVPLTSNEIANGIRQIAGSQPIPANGVSNLLTQLRELAQMDLIDGNINTDSWKIAIGIHKFLLQVENAARQQS